MMNAKKYKYILIGLFILFLFYIGLKYIIPSGSNVYAEIFTFNISEDSLNLAISKFEMEYPQYRLPYNIKEGKIDNTDNFERYFIYIRELDRTFCIDISTSFENNSMAELKLISICNGNVFNDCKIVNRDFSNSENKRLMVGFQDFFLKKLKLPYKDKGNGMKFLNIQL